MRFIFAIIAVLGLTALGVGLAPRPIYADAHFRILDVRGEYGHLVVEVEHFRGGRFWFFELYTFPGREGNNHPRVTDSNGKILLADGTPAPERVSGKDTPVIKQYLPEGKTWKRSTGIHLETETITRVIEGIHQQRLVSGWTKGQSRQTVRPLDVIQKDTNGVAVLLAKFAGLKNTAYIPSTTVEPVMLAYAGDLPPPNPGLGLFEWGTTSTFFSDAHSETTSVDGFLNNTIANQPWATIRDDGTGTVIDDSGVTLSVFILADGDTDTWLDIVRSALLFDTSALPDGNNITAGTLGMVADFRLDQFSGLIGVVASTPASNTALTTADYDQFGTTRLATDIDVSNFTVDSSTFNTFTLNATGQAAISKTGITKLGLRESHDIEDDEPTYVANHKSQIDFASTEEVHSGDKRPILTVTHETPTTAAITGTIGDGASEQDVRDGGGTIIITLTDGTWVAAGSTFNAQRSAIIQGLDSAQSEANGWNAEVRDSISVGSVGRTSSTVVTITLTQAEVAGYRVDSNEVITITVPAAAVATSSSALTAAPTATITAAVESMAVSGTLGGSGGTPAEIRAGGETIILTLSNASWADAGSGFNSQRQTILDHLVADLSDQNGWNARRSAGDFAVGNVARTSATVATITLSGSTAYAIRLTETITAIAPNEALLYGLDLTGAPTFAVVPAFQTSGNRVTAAIDLSGITDVAACAFGWIVTLPTNTTLTVETSVDGGGTYSPATNGACPTGITLGGSLAAVSDFRAKVTLTSSDTSVTPLLDAMALVIQDTTGQALYYQLDTTPGVTITDRSANSNTGTMSFPVSQTGVNATTGVLESTRSTLSLEQLLSVGDIVSPVTGAAVSGNLFNQTETGFGSLPFQDIMQTMATGGELPLKFIWVVAIGLFSIALGVVALHLTGSLMISGIGLGAGLSIGAAIGGGLIPGWTIILFVILALALVVMRSRGALPL